MFASKMPSIIPLVLSAAAIAQPCHDRWSALAEGLPGTDADRVTALAAFDDGAGPAIYAAGMFKVDHGAPANGLARWDGQTWTDAGAALVGDYTDRITDLRVFDDGPGPALYAVGAFTSIGGVAARRSAKWDGATWAEVGGGIGPLFPTSLEVADLGDGPHIYVGGWFSEAGGSVSPSVARLQDGLWTPLGDGIDGADDQFGCVYFPLVEDLKFHDGPGGPALYACGRFDYSGDTEVTGIARWDGLAWSSVGPDGGPLHAGTACTVMESHDDGLSPALYLGSWCGDNMPLGRWDGAEWSKISGAVTPSDLLSFDDGRGRALYLGSKFEKIGGQVANSIARWRDGAWTDLGGGVTAPDGTPGIVDRIIADPFNPGGLIVAGRFTSAGGLPAANIAAWSCAPCPADCNASGTLDIADWLCFNALFNTADPGADCDGSGGLDLFDFLCFVNAFNAGC
jgi:hypothetical protein